MFTSMFFYLIVLRRRQLGFAERVAQREAELWWSRATANN
jgi:hypothetical protein